MDSDITNAISTQKEPNLEKVLPFCEAINAPCVRWVPKRWPHGAAEALKAMEFQLAQKGR